MKLHAFVLSSLSLAFLFQQVFANGGPLNWTHATPRGGVALKNSEIRLVSEKLVIRINDDYTSFNVQADYKLKNPSAATKVEFGGDVPFPVRIGGLLS